MTTCSRQAESFQARCSDPSLPSATAHRLAHAFGNKSWNASKGEDRYRRSVYTFIKRTAPLPGP